MVKKGDLEVKCNIEDNDTLHYTENGIIILPLNLTFMLDIPVSFELTEEDVRKLCTALSNRLTKNMDKFIKDLTNDLAGD